MAKILSINQHGEVSGDNQLSSLWQSFLSLDKFTKIAIIIFILIALLTPYIISKSLNSIQHAATNGLVTFVNSSNTQVIETSTPNVMLQLTPPSKWTLASNSLIPKAHAQVDSSTPAQSGITPTTSTELGTTETPTPIESGPTTEAQVATASPTPSIQILFKITIQNTDNGVGGETIRTIEEPKDITAAFNTPIAWKINPLSESESSAIRTIQVTYYAHTDTPGTKALDTTTVVAASITLVKAPTLESGATTTPSTETPTTEAQVTPTTKPEEPTATSTPEQPTATLVPEAPSATPAAIVGDANGNLCVDQIDFDILKQAIITQTVIPGTNADLNHDGRIDIKDLNTWFGAVRAGTNTCR